MPLRTPHLPHPRAPLPARRVPRLTLALLACLWLGGCDLLGIESASAVAAKREAEGKAVGAGCRHALRSIEACFQENKRADKAAVFAGWREMEDYMRENKIEAVPARPDPLTAQAEGAEGEAPAAEAGKSGKAAEAKGDQKAEPKRDANRAPKAETKGDQKSEKSADKNAEKSAAKTPGAGVDPAAAAARKGA